MRNWVTGIIARFARLRVWRSALCVLLLAVLAGCDAQDISPQPSATPTLAPSPSPLVITAVPPQPKAQTTVTPYPPPAQAPLATAVSYPQPLASPSQPATRQTALPSPPERPQTGGVTLSIAFTNDVSGQIDPCG